VTPDEAFLADIIESPDDDAPRLIYSDWLEDHGQADRATFIRVQIELATLRQNDPRKPGLKTTERRLQEKHERQWAAPLPGLAGDWGFRRGFVELIALPASTLVRHADAIFRSAPVRELRLEDAGLINRWARCAQLERLTALSLSGSIGEVGLQQLLASPYLGRLRALSLAQTGIGGAGLRALAAWPQLAGLTSLDLADNSLGDEAVEALLASAHLDGLQTVDFSGNPISESLRETLKQRFGQTAYWYSRESDDDTP
jgi:uncharacterized protein (TIGR02996 family)